MESNFKADAPLGYEQITDLSAAVGLTVPSGTAYAVIQTSTQAVRWRDDGTNPTATVGMRLIVTGGDKLVYTSSGIKALRFIEEVAGAVLNVSYYGSRA